MPTIAILVLLHLYLGARLLPALASPLASTALGALLTATLLLIPAAFLGRRAQSRQAADCWTWVGMTALGLFSMLMVLTLLREGVLLAGWVFALPALPQLTMLSAAAVPVLALSAVVLGAFGARRTAAVRRVDIHIDGLPAALHGFTIVQISDVHVGPTVKRGFVERIVEAVNRLQPDAVAVTGDLVDGRVRDLQGDVAPLAGLRSRHGTFFVTGNHEYYSGVTEWTACLRGLGLKVLDNEHVVLDHDGGRLVMAGVSDYSAAHMMRGHSSDPQRAMSGAPGDAAVRILLAHQPRSAPAAAVAGFDLQLSGHTHGGQFWPWNLFVPLQQPFTAGLHRLRRLWVYTSRGTGYWGPPLRLGAPSEITQLRLMPA